MSKFLTSEGRRIMARFEKNGGKLLKPKTPVGNFGYAAYFKDTEGNTIGLWQSA